MCTVLFWAMLLSGHVEFSSSKTNCDSGEHQAHSAECFFDFSFFCPSAFSLPFICLHRLWLQRPLRNGIGGDSVRTNHGFIPIQPQLVSRALKTELLWKCMDASRGLQQRVDTGSILVLLLSHTNHTTSHSSSCIKVGRGKKYNFQQCICFFQPTEKQNIMHVKSLNLIRLKCSVSANFIMSSKSQCRIPIYYWAISHCHFKFL